MPRQKTKHTLIPNERIRKSTLRRRLDSLLKKANELSILCGVEVVLIIHDPKEGHSTLWPSQDQVMNGVMKFLAIPERERLRKMVLQEKFLTDKLEDMTESFSKLQMKNKETEMGFLINQLINGSSIDELDIRQLNDLHKFIDEKLKKLHESSDDELDQVQVQVQGQGQVSMGDISHHSHPSFEMTTSIIAGQGQESGAFATTSTATLMGNVREDKWFGSTMSGIQNNQGFSQGIDIAPEPTAMSGIQNNQGFSQGIDIAPEPTDAVTSFIEGNQDDVLDDFGKVWRSIFSP